MYYFCVYILIPGERHCVLVLCCDNWHISYCLVIYIFSPIVTSVLTSSYQSSFLIDAVGIWRALCGCNKFMLGDGNLLNAHCRMQRGHDLSMMENFHGNLHHCTCYTMYSKKFSGKVYVINSCKIIKWACCGDVESTYSVTLKFACMLYLDMYYVRAQQHWYDAHYP